MTTNTEQNNSSSYPVNLSIEYSTDTGFVKNPILFRLSVLFRFILIIPVSFALATLAGTWLFTSVGDFLAGVSGTTDSSLLETFSYMSYPIAAFGLVLTIAVTGKVPSWVFQFYLAASNFLLRVYVFALGLTQDYPSVEDKQKVSLTIEEPEITNRYLPLIQWLLVLPHYIIFIFLGIATAIAGLIGLIALIVTTKYPRSLFDFIEGSIRWMERIGAYVFGLTNKYPPFSLK